MKCSRALSIVGLALAVILNGCGKSDRKAANYVSPVVVEAVPQGPLAHVVVPIRYRLSFVIDPAKRGFVGHDEIDVTFAKPRRMLFLHGLDLDVHGVLVRLPSGKTIPAHYDQVDRSGVARLLFVDEVPSGPATLIFDYEAPFGQALDGLYKVVDRGVPYVFTQFELIAARAAFPSFDEPGFKTPFDVTVTAPAADSVIANSEETSVATLPGGLKRVVFAATKPLPTYLVALAIGPLDIVDGGYIAPDKVRSHPIHLRGVTSKGNGPRIRLALTMTPKLVIALENYFGVAYPFSKLDMLAVPDFAAGAMENAGAITFRERLLLFDANAPLEQKRGSLLVQAHELTHQWFGDLVTPKWWDDTWLNESFANWMGHKAAAAVMPQWQIDTETLRAGFDVMHTDELPSARQIHQPVHTPDDIDNAFDGITYNKGASVLTMFENYVGEDAWRAGIHAYLTKFAGGNATAKDFVSTISSASVGEGVPFIWKSPNVTSGSDSNDADSDDIVVSEAFFNRQERDSPLREDMSLHSTPLSISRASRCCVPEHNASRISQNSLSMRPSVKSRIREDGTCQSVLRCPESPNSVVWSARQGTRWKFPEVVPLGFCPMPVAKAITVLPSTKKNGAR